MSNAHQNGLSLVNGSRMDRKRFENGAMKFDKLFAVLVMLLCLGVGQVWADTTVSSSSFSNLSGNIQSDANISYSTGDGSATTATEISSSQIKLYRSTGTDAGGILLLTANNGVKIKSFTITFTGTLGYRSAANTTESAKTNYTSLSSGTAVSNLDLSSVQIGNIADTKTQAFVSAISVTYAAACSYSVTINKGTNTNCTFTLSKSGAQASCSGVSTTVTVSPTSGYGNPTVTQTGASAAPTITGSSNTYTVAYGANTTGTSTINVSCSANTYTITLNKDLTPTTAGTASITATYNANTNLTSAITKPTKTGWTFDGYYTAKNGGGTQIIDASGNVIASVSGYTDASKNWKYVGNITLYAKWTCTVTWSVNGLTNVYSTQTVTYNSSGSKVASIPGPPSPASYCGDKFVGWTTESSVSQDNDTGLGLFTTVSGSPDIKSIGDITFYAVFADYDED